MNERVIFDAALQISDPQARRAFVEKACAGNPEMLAAVESLLKSHDAAGSFLDIPAAAQVKASVSANPEDSAAAGEKTRRYQPGAIEDSEDNADEPQADLSFLQPSSKPGSIGVLAHYEVLSVLGQGAFGIVFKAFDEKLHRLVAIKVMNPQMASTSPPRKRFLREARSAAAIKHENIVQVYSVEEQPLPYLVMEFIDGQTLKQKLDGSGPLETPEVLHIARQIASGLTAAQAMGLIHRDIKPANILLEGNEGRGPRGAGRENGSVAPVLAANSPLAPAPSSLRVKISDFGLARAADDASMTRTGVISGTPMYMAPEQATGQTLDHRADLFSLGSVLYQMACGRPPFRAATTVAVLRRVVEDTPRPLQEILPEIPDWLVAIVTKLLAKKPEDRFQTAKEVADLLARCQSELQTKGEVTCVIATNSQASRAASAPGRSEPSDAVRGLTPSGSPILSATTSPANTQASGAASAPRFLPDTATTGGLTPPRSPIHSRPRSPILSRTRLLAAATVVLILAAAIVLQRANNTPTANLASREASAPGQAESIDSTKSNGNPVAEQGRSAWDDLDPAQIPEAERVPRQPEGLVAVLGQHRRRVWNRVTSSSASPDGTQFTLTTDDGLCLFGRDPKQPARFFNSPTEVSATFLPDGRIARFLLDVEANAAQLQIFAKPRDGMPLEKKTAINANGEYVATASSDGHWLTGNDPSDGGSVSLWRLSDGPPQRAAKFVLPTPHGGISPGSFSPDAQWFCFTDKSIAQSAVHLIDLRGEAPREVTVLKADADEKSDAPAKGFEHAAFLSDGRLATADRNGRIWFWKIIDGEPQRAGGIRDAGFLSPAAKSLRMVVWPLNGAPFRVWDLAVDPPQLFGSSAHSFPLDNISTLAIAPDGETVFTCHLNGTVRFWSVSQAGVTELDPLVHNPKSTLVRVKVVDRILCSSMESSLLGIWQPTRDGLQALPENRRPTWFGTPHPHKGSS